MWQFALALAALVALVLWPAKRHGPLAGRLLALAAVALAVGLWLTVAHVARMPASPTRIAAKGELTFRILVTTADSVYLEADNSLLRVALPEGRVTARLPLGDQGLGVATGLATDGRRLLFTYHRGPAERGFAIIDGGRWLVPPTPIPGDAYWLSGYWDASAHAFGLAAAGPRAGDGLQPLTLRTIDAAGRVSPPRPLSVRTSLASGALCHVGGALWLVSVFAAEPPCRVGPEIDGVAACTPVADWPGRGVYCPGQLPSLGFDENGVWLDVAGGAPTPLPAAPRGPFIAQPLVPESLVIRLQNGRLQPERRYFDAATGLVSPVGDGHVVARLVEADAAALRGHMREHEVVLHRLDAAGQFMAEAALFRPSPAFYTLAVGAELVVLSSDLEERSRFDARTLERLDGPGAIANVRERLAIWGGPALVFDGALVAALLLAPLVLALGVWLALRPRSRPGRRLTLQRLLLGYGVLALPTLVTALRSLFFW